KQVHVLRFTLHLSSTTFKVTDHATTTPQPDPMMSARFEGKTIVVTGAGGRLGRRFVEGFLADGATVAAINRSDRGLPTGDRVHPFLADLTDEDAVIETFAQI